MRLVKTQTTKNLTVILTNDEYQKMRSGNKTLRDSGGITYKLKDCCSLKNLHSDPTLEGYSATFSTDLVSTVYFDTDEEQECNLEIV